MIILKRVTIGKIIGQRINKGEDKTNHNETSTVERIRNV